MFLRKKTIKGHEYWYLVENTWNEGKSRQHVLKYLGKRESFDMGKVIKYIEEENKKKKIKKQELKESK
ncbi:MAG: hypothetical protein KAJ54_03065 [Candidatus Aenigmarchaeota archaeon]|nr:hypothetical protein [Candidatus Aenigmarchaeota archaeon]MCK5322069.1 hypothetical protein [Candidatus Aenigmarchaeota archaeon]